MASRNKEVLAKTLPEEAKPHAKDSAMCFQIGEFIEFSTGTLEEVFDKLPTIFGEQLRFSYHQHGVIKVFAPAYNKCDYYEDVGRIVYGEENVKQVKTLRSRN